MFAYVGCYTTPERGGRGEGISIFNVDTTAGSWEYLETVGGLTNPSYLAIDSQRRSLYCVHSGSDVSEVSALAIDPVTGHLSHLGTQSSGGANPVSLSVWPNDEWLIVANYLGGTLGLLRIGDDGQLEPLQEVVNLKSVRGVAAPESARSLPHHTVIDPAQRFVIVPDKGLDCVFTFHVDPSMGTLVPGEQPFPQSREGAGPRHAAFSPDGSHLYCINELDATLTTYAYDRSTGGLLQRGVVSTLPANFGGNNKTAEIHVSPSGRYVYGSNRGHDSIVICAVDPQERTLSPIAWEPTQGRGTRYFALDPAGRYLYAANRGSDSIVTFAVDQERGTLTPTGQVIESPSPSFILFVEP